jgi:hypothetical protein
VREIETLAPTGALPFSIFPLAQIFPARITGRSIQNGTEQSKKSPFCASLGATY